MWSQSVFLPSMWQNHQPGILTKHAPNSSTGFVFLLNSPTIHKSHKSHNAVVPYHTMRHSEEKCAYLLSELCIVGYDTVALCDWWIRSIRIHVINVPVYLSMPCIVPFDDYTQTPSGDWKLTFKISLVVSKIIVMIKRLSTTSMVAMKVYRMIMSCRK